MAAAESPWLDEREQRAWRGFLDMHALVNRSLASQLQRDTDVSLADYAVLVTLTESDEGQLRSFAIAESLQWEASRLSHQLRRMRARGLVERRPCPEDRRGINVAITPAGREAIDAAAPLHVAEVRRVFIDHLDDTHLDALADAADRVRGVPTDAAPAT
ncbi:MAG TPA: MarR family transcriptional regulator [Acidimicrobiales bacterium]|nr:MarR family transcriptional regulator [Acidimicrobiales bacterium]